MLGRADAGCRGMLHVGTRLQVFPLVPSCHTKCTTLHLSSTTLVSNIFTYLSAGLSLAMSLVMCRSFNARLELDPHSLIICSASEVIRSLDMYRPVPVVPKLLEILEKRTFTSSKILCRTRKLTLKIMNSMWNVRFLLRSTRETYRQR